MTSSETVSEDALQLIWSKTMTAEHYPAHLSASLQ